MDDKQKVKEESWSRFQNDFIRRGGTIHEAWQSGFDAGLAHAQQWVEMDQPPREGGNYLVSIDTYNDNSWTEEAQYRDGHWWMVRTDGYNEPIKACEFGRVTAYREMPEPFTPKETTV